MLKRTNNQSVFIGKGAVIQAKYRSTGLPNYRGNPLIEALPPINSREKVIEKLQKIYTPTARNNHFSVEKRMHLVMDLLRFFQPLPIHLTLETRFSRMIRDGYLTRNPENIHFYGDLKARLQNLRRNESINVQLPSVASGFSIVGMSGVGKSTSVQRILSLYPQVIIHSQYKGKDFNTIQVTWLKLDCPQDGSIKGLCLSFLATFDDLLGTEYFQFYGRGRTIDELIIHMTRVAANHHLGLLVIDEIQNLNEAKVGGATKTLNFFVQLVNTIGLPVVLIGSYKAIPVLSSEFRLARRSSGQGDLIWNRMPFNEDWQVFIESLWSMQYVEHKTKLTPVLSRCLYDLAFGVTDLAIRIYMSAQWRAIETGEEKITKAMLTSIYRDDFKLVNHILETIKGSDRPLLYSCDDICPPSFDIDQPIINLLPDLKENSTAKNINGKATAKVNNPLLQESQRIKNSSEKVKNDALPPKDFRTIVNSVLNEKSTYHPYEALAKAGYIKPATEFTNEE